MDACALVSICVHKCILWFECQAISLVHLIEVLETIRLDQYVDKVSEYFLLGGMENGIVISSLSVSLMKAGVPGGTAVKVTDAATKRLTAPTPVCRHYSIRILVGDWYQGYAFHILTPAYMRT